MLTMLFSQVMHILYIRSWRSLPNIQIQLKANALTIILTERVGTGFIDARMIFQQEMLQQTKLIAMLKLIIVTGPLLNHSKEKRT